MAVEFEHIDVKIDPYDTAIRFVLENQKGNKLPAGIFFTDRVKRLVGMNTVRFDWGDGDTGDMELTEHHFNKHVSYYKNPRGDIVGMDIRKASMFFSPAQLEAISLQAGQLITI